MGRVGVEVEMKIFLSNWCLAYMGICGDSGEKIVSIPRSTKLMKLIGESILLKPTSVRGAEIRFLRKNLHLKINEFGQLFGLDRVTVSRRFT